MDNGNSKFDETYEDDCGLMQELKYTYHAFFQSFGRFTPIQRSSIPVLLHGEHALLISSTASGKTEAVCAPIIENHIFEKKPWTILYVCPTRALVNDLYYRLLKPIQSLSLTLKRRTGDHRDTLKTIPHLIITTPESFDSLLCRNKRRDSYGHDLAHVVAVVIDEIHLIDGSPRGDQVKWLIQRLKKLREYANQKNWTHSSNLQVIGLSATIPNIDIVCRDYFPDSVKVLQSSKQRPIEDVISSSKKGDTESAVISYIKNLDRPEKILIFSNSRKRVDTLTKFFSKKLRPYGYEVRAHHGSLSKSERESTEYLARNLPQIIICATSTLEIGIDIGDIDLIVLDGPPPDISALLQRIGRGNRRTDKTRVMICAGSMVELLLQNAMLEAAREGWLGTGFHGPNYAVIRQQIASYIFQSPGKTRSKNSLIKMGQNLLSEESIVEDIIETMVDNQEIIPNIRNNLKLGEYWWKKAEVMGQLHSNIERRGGMDVVDIDTGGPIAYNVLYDGGKYIGVGGKALEVRKWENMTLEVRKAVNEAHVKGKWSYVASPQFQHASQPEAIRRYFLLENDIWPLVRRMNYSYIFHLGGSVRAAVLRLLVEHYGSEIPNISINGWYIRFPSNLDEKPSWCDNFTPSLLKLLLYEDTKLSQVEGILMRPAANKNLPKSVRIREVWDWLNIDVESSTIKKSKWDILADKTTEEALKLFIRS